MALDKCSMVSARFSIVLARLPMVLGWSSMALARFSIVLPKFPMVVLVFSMV